ncbi:MAG: SxtJ family membrane protein [Nitrospiraceae bacterium]
MIKDDISSRQLRSFGLIVGGVFAIIGLWPMFVRDQDFRGWALVIAGLFLISALAVPSSLRLIHRVWMFIGHILGWINTRIILAIGFYGIVMPVGLVMRTFGKDPMRRRYLAGAITYRVTRTSRPGSHMQQQF